MLRFTASSIGVASAALYLLGRILWDGSWLSEHHPWAAVAPLALTFLFGGPLVWIDLWRTMTRTLSPGSPDMFRKRWSDFCFPGAWEAVFILGFMLMVAGWVAGLAISAAGFCLFMAAGSQARSRAYEDEPGAQG